MIFVAAITRIAITVMLALAVLCTAALADHSAAVLIYHRFGEDTIPSTSIRLSQFEAHLDLLASGNHVLSAADAVRRIKAGNRLPHRSVVITVDDAFRSFMTEAWPRLKARGMPVTLFVATDAVDARQPGYLTWDDIRRLKSEGVDIGHHGAAHLHMADVPLTEARADIGRASQRFQEELGSVPALFAWPYGEHTPATADLLRDMGFEAGFAQFSAPAAGTENLFALPRFAISDRYGSLDRLRLVTSTLPMPVADVVPTTPIIDAAANPPVVGFTLDLPTANPAALACFPSHLSGAAPLVVLGNRVEVRFSEPFPYGRSRINCTLRSEDGRWHWFGKFFYRRGGVLD